MADFYQTGVVTTLHRLGPSDPNRLEAELKDLSRSSPLALVLPSLFSELEGEALPAIVEELKRVPYIHRIVVSLDRASAAEFHVARRFFSRLPQQLRIIWNDGPRIQELFREMAAEGLRIGRPGKGRGTWLASGYILAEGTAHVIALHDCDILTYSRDLLARLVYPVMNRRLNYSFAKGYYARISGRMHGRVTRLFMTPFLRAFIRLIGYHPLLAFMDSFRYPLSGEFAMVAELARVNRIPGDWGLEVGTLFEVYRNCALRHICEVDIADAYDHKHQDLSPEDPDQGLFRMAREITEGLLRTLASEGVILPEGFFDSLEATYERLAQDTMKRYEDDAALNGLSFDRHPENLALETFSRAIRQAAREFRREPRPSSVAMPNWMLVEAAIPDIGRKLCDAVEADNA